MNLAVAVLAFSGSAGTRRVAAPLRRVGASSHIAASADVPARREMLAATGSVLAASLIAAPASSSAFDLFGAAEKSAWTQVDVPVETILFDVEFDTNQPDHGWVVGNKV
ncbi:hypothetical protein T492DRAFT_893792 [Pavlovales sp. CCMP2436]|nr:hypothetical protein T492DRAFT_893792 [Pavlovales sp. CCMP2436]